MRGGAILVVDDDPLVLDFVRGALQRGGYEVLTAASAEEALRVFARGGATPDLIVSDVRMPGLSGVQLASRIREISPATPTLLMSGFAGDEIGPGTEFLPKPFDSRVLLARIRRLLKKTSGSRVRRAPAS